MQTVFVNIRPFQCELSLYFMNLRLNVSKTTTTYKRTYLNLIFRPLFVSYLYNKVKCSLLSITFFVFLRVFSPFPSSLRFLIQQHLELLHTLQERVLKCQWQGIMGDVFMRLTSKEVKQKLRV